MTRTVTYDEAQWKLVPIDPTAEMMTAYASSEKMFNNSHTCICAAIKAAPPYPDQSGEVNEMVWIPVSERLPEIGVPVLGLTNRVDIGAYLRADTGEGDGSWIWAAFEYGYISDPRMYDVDDEYIVDAWMPLPSAPKGEE